MSKHLKVIVLFSLLILTQFVGCKKITELKNKGIPTVIKGNVSDNFKGMPIEGFKVTLGKSLPCFKNFMSADCGGEVASVTTDKNGNYVINFDHQLNENESYYLYFFQYPYTSQSKDPVKFTAGQQNITDIDAWIPVKLRLNLDIKNNKVYPLIVGINYQNNYNYGTDFIYEKDIKKTLEVRARPNSEVSIDFWYNENYNFGNPIRHLKSVKHTTDLKEITELNFEVDCSKF
ncbi:carboxypeptidase regulatory-like domain-containing protein [Pedobacter frigidisoli]|uniref:Carboxypeptidase regulatory-like domain-containing protein n=1 Tax=Pedobacter frigidisoli TaxID=2530455 RepID=A0A4V2MN75_9SPHI|nr:carboxypeptidase-like regulatory domain-containing protein [Pedobacter frigidisoli]TCD11620.1 carboxypeptidase regulatory-like domain-containing protein [Pedobacter frigidisoli]